MPRNIQRHKVAPQSVEAVLNERIESNSAAIRILQQAKISSLQVVDIENFNDPAEGVTVINWPTSQICFYHNNEWICIPMICHSIKLSDDRKVTRVEDGRFRFAIEPDLHNYEIVMMKAFCGTASGSATLTVANHTRGDLVILSSPLTIPGGSTVSNLATTANTIIDTEVAGRRTNNWHEDDMLWINVLSNGGQKGMGIHIYFNKPLVDNTV